MAAVTGAITPRLTLPGRFGLLHTTRLFTEPYGTAASGYTFLLLTGSEAPFDWVRLVYQNHTAAPYTIGAASVAPSAHPPANDTSAYRADESAQPFTTVTFNAAGQNGLPPSPSGSTGSLVVPAVTGSAPALVFSDWIQVSSIAPSDGGTFNYLLVRTFVSAGSPSMPIATPNTKLTTDFPAIAGGRALRSNYAAGDITAATGTISGVFGPAGYVTPCAVQFYSRKRGMTVLGIGDSLEQGRYSTSDHNGAGFQAAKALSTPDFPVFYANHGYSAQPSALSYAAGRAALDAYAPDVALLPVYSPNDPPDTQAKVDASFARALDLAHYCITRGTVPIVKTAMPWGALSGPGEALRTSLNARARGLSPGIMVADYDAAVTDGASPARLKAAFNSGDGLHLNDAGYAACAAALAPLLRRLIAAARGG